MPLIEQLIVVYTNEKSTSSLLPYNDIADEFNLILSNRLATVKNTIEIEELEIERIKYFIKEYILCRFDKICNNLYHDLALMSEDEKAFYLGYIQLQKKFDVYQENVETAETINKNEFVGFIANRNIQAVKIDKEIVEIFEGDVFIASLVDVYSYLLDNSITLI